MLRFPFHTVIYFTPYISLLQLLCQNWFLEPHGFIEYFHANCKFRCSNSKNIYQAVKNLLICWPEKITRFRAINPEKLINLFKGG